MNLVGYCAEKGQHMLVYVYMSQGSLASHLYGKYATNFYNVQMYVVVLGTFLPIIHG